MTPSCWSGNRLQFTIDIAVGGVFKQELVESRPGFVCFKVTGKGSVAAFKHEGGGHRWQRIPPNEKRGRRHTSTITVAVLREPNVGEVEIDQKDLVVATCRGSGAGGQHRNVTDSAVQISYRGITVRCESERSQHKNKAMAMSILRARVLAREEEVAVSSENKSRKKQVGSGMRGDKVRTIRVFADQVKDHRTGKKMKYAKYARGFVEGLI